MIDTGSGESQHELLHANIVTRTHTDTHTYIHTQTRPHADSHTHTDTYTDTHTHSHTHIRRLAGSRGFPKKSTRHASVTPPAARHFQLPSVHVITFCSICILQYLKKILARSAGDKGLPRPQLGHAARSAGDNGLPRPQLGLRAKRRRQGACPVIGLGLVLINFYWISLRSRK